MGGTKTIQTTDINPVNNVDHEERGGEVLDERGEEEDDEEEEAEEEEEVEEEEEAEEEEREEVPPPAVQSRPPSTNTTQRQHANTKHHTHPTRIGGLGIVTKQGPATSTGTTRNPYLRSSIDFNPVLTTSNHSAKPPPRKKLKYKQPVFQT